MPTQPVDAAGTRCPATRQAGAEEQGNAISRDTQRVPFDFETLATRVDGLANLAPGVERGKALEDLVAEVLDELPGIAVTQRNVLAAGGEAEIDLFLVNTGDPDGLPGLPRDLLVECKTQGDPINSQTVQWFASQLERRDLAYGIVVALAGLTGNDDNARHAHHELVRSAEHGQRMLVLVENELRGISNPSHLAAVLEFKRQALVASFRTALLTDEQLAQLNPDRRQPRRGLGAIEDLMREIRQSAIDEILDEAAELPELDLEATVERARTALAEVAGEVEAHNENPEDDPFWRTARTAVVNAAAAFVAMLDPVPKEVEDRRVFSFEMRVSAPAGLAAHAGSELWSLLTDYYLRQLAGAGRTSSHSRAVLAVTALAVEEMIAIDDIDPHDVYGDEVYGEL